jgi:hypothetical protein
MPQRHTDTQTHRHTHTHRCNTDLDKLAGKKHAQSCGPAADQLVDVVAVPVIAVDLERDREEENAKKSNRDAGNAKKE